ncbi:hypothetical protein O59_000078 [Cellvibrio sp. BR]|nr:hypothetical protein O59_000078 [Cellvibrio sp. BR]
MAGLVCLAQPKSPALQKIIISLQKSANNGHPFWCGLRIHLLMQNLQGVYP